MTEDEQRAYLEQAMSNSTSGYLLALDAANFSPEVGNQLIKEGLVGNFGGEQILSVEKAEGVREGFRAFVSMPMIEYKFGAFSNQWAQPLRGLANAACVRVARILGTGTGHFSGSGRIGCYCLRWRLRWFGGSQICCRGLTEESGGIGNLCQEVHFWTLQRLRRSVTVVIIVLEAYD